MKFDTGRNRSFLADDNSTPAPSLTDGISTHTEDEFWYCHLPSVLALAAFPTTATPTSVLALEPPVPAVTASVESLKFPENRVLTVAPAIEAAAVSSVMEANVALPDATGASFTAVTLVVNDTVDAL